MKKAHRILLCALFFLVCAAFPTTVSVPKQRPQITEEKYERLRPGMTEKEVAEILGGPPGDRRGASWAWDGPQGSRIDVLFSDDGKLMMKFFAAPPTVQERIGAVLRLLQPTRRLVIVETDGAKATWP
jgi:hypothetical protein